MAQPDWNLDVRTSGAAIGVDVSQMVLGSSEGGQAGVRAKLEVPQEPMLQSIERIAGLDMAMSPGAKTVPSRPRPQWTLSPRQNDGRSAAEQHKQLSSSSNVREAADSRAHCPGANATLPWAGPGITEDRRSRSRAGSGTKTGRSTGPGQECGGYQGPSPHQRRRSTLPPPLTRGWP